MILQKPYLGEQPNIFAPGREGLVGEWWLNEGAGPTAYDLSGRGNDGPITSATWVADYLYFDGGDDFVDLIADGVSMPTSGSIIIRTKIRTVAVNDTLIQDLASGYIDWDINNGSLRVRIYDADFTTWADVCSDTNWHTYVLVWNTNYTALYKDGVQFGALDATFTGLIGSCDGLRVGADRLGADFMPMNVDYASLYNRAITAGEIAQMHINPKRSLGYTQEEDIVQWGSYVPVGGTILPHIMQLSA